LWNSNGISYSSPLLCFYTLLSHHLNQRSIAILNSYFNDASKLYFHNHTGNSDDFHIATLSRTVFAILTKIMYPNRLILVFFDVSSEENIFHFATLTRLLELMIVKHFSILVCLRIFIYIWLFSWQILAFKVHVVSIYQFFGIIQNS